MSMEEFKKPCNIDKGKKKTVVNLGGGVGAGLGAVALLATAALASAFVARRSKGRSSGKNGRRQGQSAQPQLNKLQTEEDESRKGQEWEILDSTGSDVHRVDQSRGSAEEVGSENDAGRPVETMISLALEENPKTEMNGGTASGVYGAEASQQNFSSIVNPKEQETESYINTQPSVVNGGGPGGLQFLDEKFNSDPKNSTHEQKIQLNEDINAIEEISKGGEDFNEAVTAQGKGERMDSEVCCVEGESEASEVVEAVRIDQTEGEENLHVGKLGSEEEKELRDCCRANGEISVDKCDEAIEKATKETGGGSDVELIEEGASVNEEAASLLEATVPVHQMEAEKVKIEEELEGWRNDDGEMIEEKCREAINGRTWVDVVTGNDLGVLSEEGIRDNHQATDPNGSGSETVVNGEKVEGEDCLSKSSNVEIIQKVDEAIDETGEEDPHVTETEEPLVDHECKEYNQPADEKIVDVHKDYDEDGRSGSEAKQDSLETDQLLKMIQVPDENIPVVDDEDEAKAGIDNLIVENRQLRDLYARKESYEDDREEKDLGKDELEDSDDQNKMSEKEEKDHLKSYDDEEEADDDKKETDLSYEEESSVESGDSSMDSNPWEILPAESGLQSSSPHEPVKKLMEHELEAKIQEDIKLKEGTNDSQMTREKSLPQAGKAEENFCGSQNNKGISSRLSNGKGINNDSPKTFADKNMINLEGIEGHQKYSTRRMMLIGMFSVLSSLSFSWFFGVSFVKLCVLLFFAMALSQIHAY